ncbi:MAG: methyltransferase domain-containing protein [Oligoflexales bacterium]|nr:methyltransferase domain-containing protein [Oligoflexales bacterium]
MTGYRFEIQNIMIGERKFSFNVFSDFEKTIDRYLDTLNPKELDLTKHRVPLYGRIWPSALALGRFINENYSNDLGRKKVLELGCGIALPGMVATALGGKTTAADYLAEIGELLEKNKRLNGLSGIEFRLMDWQSESTPEGNYDFVIASDILYERQYFAQIIDLLLKVSHSNTRIIIADPVRTYYGEFIEAAKKKGFSVKTEDLCTYDEASGKDLNIRIMTLAFASSSSLSKPRPSGRGYSS